MPEARTTLVTDRAALVDAVRRYELPEGKLPLCPDRQPFERLPDELIERMLASAASVPERRGRYTDAGREVMGTSAPVLGTYIVIESHIDLTYVDDDLTVVLAAEGFEPDDFALMEPAQYTHHFTQQFVCATQDRVTELHRLLLRANAAAIRIIDEHPIASGYLETEVYRSEYSVKYAPVELSMDAIEHFPSDRLRFDVRAVPRSAAEAEVGGLPVQARRAADIHVKISGGFPAGAWQSADRLIRHRRANRPPTEELLVDRLTAAGFYEIISQAGNFLFSAHFADMNEASVTAGSPELAADVLNAADPRTRIVWIVKADPTCFPPPLVARLAARADVVVLNAAEVAFVGSLERLRGSVVITDGAGSIRYGHNDVWAEQSVMAAEVDDVTGAGDAFAGALVATLSAAPQDLAAGITAATTWTRSFLMRRSAGVS